MDRPIWEGVYQDIRDVEAVGAGFNSDTWVRKSKKQVEEFLSGTDKQNPIPSIPIRPASIGLAASLSRCDKNGPHNIIDFGGGLGFSFLSFMQSCQKAQEYEYHIIESEAVCRAGEELFADYRNIHFYDDIQGVPFKRAEIVYMNSVLQYIEDWRSLLKHLFMFKPDYMLMDGVPAGMIPTFATGQNYYDSVIPYWYFNVEEIISFFEGNGFSLDYKSKYLCAVLGQIQKIPMNNFPAEYRLDYPCTMLFSRQSK